MEIISSYRYAFRDLVNLKTIKLDKNGLTEIPEHLFRASKEVDEIDFSWNPITTMSATLFRGLEKLTKLYLFKNRLTHIDG